MGLKNIRVEEAGGQLRSRLEQAEAVIAGQRRELERSLAAQKALIQQLQEGEAEARELQEFLQAEKGTLQVLVLLCILYYTLLTLYRRKLSG